MLGLMQAIALLSVAPLKRDTNAVSARLLAHRSPFQEEVQQLVCLMNDDALGPCLLCLYVTKLKKHKTLCAIKVHLA